MVLGYEDLADSYIFSGDWSTENPATISASQSDYAMSSIFAIVQGEVHIFGGDIDGRRVNFNQRRLPCRSGLGNLCRKPESGS